jgi:Protein of unknown function (DUF4058)
MPSPFPGMDPYLEDPRVFPDFHYSYSTYLREALQAVLPEPYYAALGERVWIEVSQRYIGPDVSLLRSRPSAPEQGSGGGVAVAAPPRLGPVVVRVPHDERREPTIEIYQRHEGGPRLITSIEVLSLTNKTPGEHGRSLYLRKQGEILESRTHLVEIDLLRAGEHTTAVPRADAVARTGGFDYHVCIHHWDNLEDYFVYPIRLPDPLPEIAIPLLPGDPPVPLDLQAVFNRCYDAGPYRREVRYREVEPVPPLTPEHAQWAAERLGAAFGPS